MKTGFRTWLFRQHTRRDSIGDLAIDAREDYRTRESTEGYPKRFTPDTFRAYLRSLHACKGALGALDLKNKSLTAGSSSALARIYPGLLAKSYPPKQPANRFARVAGGPVASECRLALLDLKHLHAFGVDDVELRHSLPAGKACS